MSEASHAEGPGPLTKKVVGQPAWVWIIGVVVLILGAQWYRTRSAQVSAQATQLAASAAGLAQDPTTKGTGTLPQGAGTPVATAGPMMSTDEWLSAARKAASNAGEDPIHAARALSAFLNGGDLSYQDTLVVNAALDAVGQPPGFSTIPPGTWQDRPLPKGPTPVKLVAQPNSPGVFILYSDGSLKSSAGVLDSFVATHPDSRYASGAPKVEVLPLTDPVWSGTIDYGAGGKAGYDATVQTFTKGDPNYVPYWATGQWIAQQQVPPK